MSNYTAPAIHPRTGEVEEAMWMDNHFGHHRYGVKFPDGTIWPQEKVKVPPLIPTTEDEAAEQMDNGRNTGGRYDRPHNR